MNICCSKNSLELKMSDIRAKKLFKNGLKKITNSINKEIGSLCWEIEKLTKRAEIEKSEKEKFALFADILFKKLTNDYNENADELRNFVFLKADEMKAEREKENGNSKK